MTRARKKAARARVMDHRKTADDKGALDDYPTPLWATRALCERVGMWAPGWGADGLAGRRIWEPACGRGTMSRALQEYGAEVVESDIAAGSASGD